MSEDDEALIAKCRAIAPTFTFEEEDLPNDKVLLLARAGAHELSAVCPRRWLDCFRTEMLRTCLRDLSGGTPPVVPVDFVR